VSQLRQRSEELGELGVEPVLVSFASALHTRQYVAERRLEWPVLIDERRELYRAYDMGRAPLWEVWGPATWMAYGRALLAGERLRPGRDDPRQRGGDVLVDPEGILRLHHAGRGPADRPSVNAIIACVRRLRASDSSPDRA
jgi:hypothetical protein